MKLSKNWTVWSTPYHLLQGILAAFCADFLHFESHPNLHIQTPQRWRFLQQCMQGAGLLFNNGHRGVVLRAPHCLGPKWNREFSLSRRLHTADKKTSSTFFPSGLKVKSSQTYFFPQWEKNHVRFLYYLKYLKFTPSLRYSCFRSLVWFKFCLWLDRSKSSECFHHEPWAGFSGTQRKWWQKIPSKVNIHELTLIQS